MAFAFDDDTPKPCPFCYSPTLTYVWAGEELRVGCARCKATGPPVYGGGTATDAELWAECRKFWDFRSDQRQPPPSIPARIRRIPAEPTHTAIVRHAREVESMPWIKSGTNLGAALTALLAALTLASRFLSGEPITIGDVLAVSSALTAAFGLWRAEDAKPIVIPTPPDDNTPPASAARRAA